MKSISFDRKTIFTLSAVIYLSNLVIRIYLNWPLNQTISTPDSISYRPSFPDSQTFPYEGLVPLSKLSEISVIGNALRPWTINLIFQLFSNDSEILIFQIFYATFAWTFLIFVLLRLHFPKINKYLSIVVIYIFSLTPYIYSWEKFILSESIVNSTFIIFVGLLVHKVIDGNGIINNIFLYLSWIFLLISRPIFGLAVFPLLFFTVNFKSIKNVIKNLIIFTIFIVYMIILNQNSSNKWLEYLGTPREGLTFSHFASPSFSNNYDFIYFSKLASAPDCLFHLESKDDNSWFTARNYNLNCKNGVEWIQSKFMKNYIYFLFSPHNFNNFVLKNTLESLRGVDLRKFYPFYSFNTPYLLSFFNSVFWIKYSWQLFIYLFISIILFIILKIKRNSFLIYIWVYFFSIIGSLAQISLMAKDYGRLGLPGSIIFNLFSILFILNLLAYFILKNLKR